jgi:hypothetical protein
MRRSSRGAWLWRSTLAVVLASAGVLVPAPAADVRAADGLDIKADATYRIDTDDAVVRVRIDVVITNRTPNRTVNVPGGTQTTQYYYNSLTLPMQLEGRGATATSGGSTLRTSTSTEEGYRLVTIRFPNLFYQRSRTIRLEYEIRAGKPRSTSDIRVGPAFATFTAWAVGDDGKSTVRIVLPAGFEDDGYGTKVTTTMDDGRRILRSGAIADPGDWYRVIIADRPEALTDLTVGTADESIVIHAWPDDTEWIETVGSVLEEGVPLLKEAIGLPWPVNRDLDVYQVHTPLLEGYGGFYDSRADEIRISEDLDPHLILHEASHAWLDSDLLGERWIYEGLAETYSARVLVAIDGDAPDPAPAAVTSDDAAAFPLSTWPQPERIDDDETAARETYGYAASWTIMQAIVDDIGIEGMQEVLLALDDRTSAYRQEGRPAPVRDSSDWRRFLDLIEEVGASSPMTERFRTWVVRDEDHDELDARLDAREVLDALEVAGDGWAPPVTVLASMGRWRFQDALDSMTVAQGVLDARDDLAAIEADLGTTSPDDLEERYERIVWDEDATALEDELASRGAVATELIATREALAVEPSLLAQIGLMGELPATGLETGLDAYTSGDMDAASDGAGTSMALLDGAEAVGQERVIMAAAITLATILALVVLIALVWRWRRGRRRRRALAVAGLSTTLAATPVLGPMAPTLEIAPVPITTEPTLSDPPPTESRPGADAD